MLRINLCSPMLEHYEIKYHHSKGCIIFQIKIYIFNAHENIYTYNIPITINSKTTWQI